MIARSSMSVVSSEHRVWRLTEKTWPFNIRLIHLLTICCRPIGRPTKVSAAANVFTQTALCAIRLRGSVPTFSRGRRKKKQMKFTWSIDAQNKCLLCCHVGPSGGLLRANNEKFNQLTKNQDVDDDRTGRLLEKAPVATIWDFPSRWIYWSRSFQGSIFYLATSQPSGVVRSSFFLSAAGTKRMDKVGPYLDVAATGSNRWWPEEREWPTAGTTNAVRWRWNEPLIRQSAPPNPIRLPDNNGNRASGPHG